MLSHGFTRGAVCPRIRLPGCVDFRVLPPRGAVALNTCASFGGCRLSVYASMLWHLPRATRSLSYADVLRGIFAQFRAFRAFGRVAMRVLAHFYARAVSFVCDTPHALVTRDWMAR